VNQPHHAYWRKTRTMTAMLLLAWVALTVACGIYARELRDVAGLLYAAIIATYAWYVRKHDVREARRP
jgi:uncharacterized membrane protein